MSTGYFSQKEREKLGEELESNEIYFAQKTKSNRYYQNKISFLGGRAQLSLSADLLYQLSH